MSDIYLLLLPFLYQKFSVLLAKLNNLYVISSSGSARKLKKLQKPRTASKISSKNEAAPAAAVTSDGSG